MNPAKIFSDFFRRELCRVLFFGGVFGEYGWVQAGNLLSKGHPAIIGRSRPINLTTGSWEERNYFMTNFAEWPF